MRRRRRRETVRHVLRFGDGAIDLVWRVRRRPWTRADLLLAGALLVPLALYSVYSTGEVRLRHFSLALPWVMLAAAVGLQWLASRVKRYERWALAGGLGVLSVMALPTIVALDSAPSGMPAVLEQIGVSLHAAAVSEGGRELLAAGRFTQPLTLEGFEAIAGLAPAPINYLQADLSALTVNGGGGDGRCSRRHRGLAANPPPANTIPRRTRIRSSRPSCATTARFVFLRTPEAKARR